MLKKNLDTILIIAVAVLLTLQISNMFRKSPVNEDLIRAKMKIEYQDKMIEIISDDRINFRNKYDSVTALLLGKDANKAEQEKQIIVKYEKIPVYINSLNRDSLRAAVKRYSLLPD